jgi:3-isopropylmalate/(R)-2-methylmalate dehydratase small subunit
MIGGGRAWVFGDDVDTDAIAPGAHMKGPIQELAAHCLETLNPAFAREVRPGDVVVAGRNFGMGSSREQAPQALRHLGVAAVVARSFAGIFYRNALNLGLPALVSGDVAEIRAGERIELNPETGAIRNLDTGAMLRAEPLPAFLVEMLRDGGLVPHLEKRLRRAS